MENDILQLDENSADEFCRLRIELFKELGEIDENAGISELEAATKRYYQSHINKDLFSWGIFQGGELVSVGSLCLFNRIPYGGNLNGAEGYVLNIYTSPQFRKRGFANRILNKIAEYAGENNIKRLFMNSSEQGKNLYSRLGFTEKGNEMELFL